VENNKGEGGRQLLVLSVLRIGWDSLLTKAVSTSFLGCRLLG